MNRIYCFSGTGNTLFTAKRFAEAIPDSSIELISRQDRAGHIEPDGDRFGIFFPVYCFGVPGIVIQFLRRLRKPKGQQPFVYIVVVSGGMCGASQIIAQEELNRVGIELNAVFHIIMPSNYIPLSAPPSPEKRERIFTRANRMIEKAISAVEKQTSNQPLRIPILDSIEALVARKADDTLKNADRWFWTDEHCNGCELCAKICPNSNITMENGKPHWNHFCEQCMACIQWCPQESIQFRNITMKRARYHHPDIQCGEISRTVL